MLHQDFETSPDQLCPRSREREREREREKVYTEVDNHWTEPTYCVTNNRASQIVTMNSLPPKAWWFSGFYPTLYHITQSVHPQYSTVQAKGLGSRRVLSMLASPAMVARLSAG